MSLFGAGEVYQFAIRIEEDGEHYYRQIAKKLKEEEAKKLFEFLADEEVEHKKIFGEMLRSIEHYTPAESYPEEYFEYLKAYADNVIFNEARLKDELSLVKDPVSAAYFGISRELQSIAYYQDIKKVVPKADAAKIDTIIAEERKHFLKLVDIKNRYSKKGGK